MRGSISGNKYNVNVSGWKDKVEYDKACEEVIKPAETDCAPVIDSPEQGKEISPY